LFLTTSRRGWVGGGGGGRVTWSFRKVLQYGGGGWD